MTKEVAVNCNNVIGVACNDCTEPCIMKFSDEEWEAYKLYQKDILTALQEQEQIESDISEYYRLKNELRGTDLLVEEVVNLNLDYLHKRKKEVTLRLKKLRRMEYTYTKRLLKLQKKR